MRYGNLFRFLTLTFVIGSLLGLSAGLVSGGNAASPSSGEQQGLSEESNTATQKDRLTPEKARIIAANELGQVMVLEYHRIGTVEEEWTRTPDGLREDIQLLKQAGYFPVNTISVPFGEYPEDISILESGTWEDNGYQYLGALEVAGGPSASPFSTSFNPMHISRIQAGEGVVKKWIKYFEDNPGLRYVSDGDLLTVSVPVQPHTDLGDLSPGLGRPVMTY